MSQKELTDRSIQALRELGLVLKTVYLRLEREGYKLVDGKLIAPT